MGFGGGGGLYMFPLSSMLRWHDLTRQLTFYFKYNTASYRQHLHSARKKKREKFPRIRDINYLLLINNRNVKDIINKIELYLLISSQIQKHDLFRQTMVWHRALFCPDLLSLNASTLPKSQDSRSRPIGQGLFLLMFIFDGSNESVTCWEESFLCLFMA